MHIVTLYQVFLFSLEGTDIVEVILQAFCNNFFALTYNFSQYRYLIPNVPYLFYKNFMKNQLFQNRSKIQCNIAIELKIEFEF